MGFMHPELHQRLAARPQIHHGSTGAAGIALRGMSKPSATWTSLTLAPAAVIAALVQGARVRTSSLEEVSITFLLIMKSLLLAALLLSGCFSVDIDLMRYPGLTPPPSPTVQIEIHGHVKKEGVYTVQRRLTQPLKELITLAGGFDPMQEYAKDGLVDDFDRRVRAKHVEEFDLPAGVKLQAHAAWTAKGEQEPQFFLVMTRQADEWRWLKQHQAQPLLGREAMALECRLDAGVSGNAGVREMAWLAMTPEIVAA